MVWFAPYYGYKPLILYLVYHLVLFPLFRSDLRFIPGPALSKFTDLYPLLLARTGSAHEHHLHLHKRYGPFVRLGPNNVSVGSPAAIPILYNARTRYPKSAFYPVMGNVAHGKVVPIIFFMQDESIHESMKRPIAQVYAMTNFKTYEPLIDSTKSLCLTKLEKFVEEGRPLDLGTWLHWFTTDVIMEITFGKRLGFLERDEDVDGMLETIEKRFWYTGQMPWLDRLLHRNPLVDLFTRFVSKPSVSPVLEFSLKRIAEQKSQRHDHPERTGQEPDFLVMYHLLKNPDSMKTLIAELENSNHPSPVPWDIAHKLPYLDACNKEALRITPAIGISLERVAPAEGIELCGKYFGSGTVLGVNAWMERALFAFAGGSRVCLGKNISYLEMYKVIPEMLQRFKSKDSRKNWSLKNGFSTYTRDVEVSIQRRESS
ncbi:pisatin demethylase [Aspergillus pseudotamarii]|uniref:Pisatin demethylase n=1 Tax=Aspergillus pseudotamarii TaxID=132259 RepID=A0A5N6T4R0_ASPPS|nr:pisatin demethylase [Aspergillus pseudotamarii]KAE8141298.1 pisatin demethylase [Aspergillus pseudotamarii]